MVHHTTSIVLPIKKIKMRIIRNLIVLTLVALAVISCEKENTFNTNVTAPTTAKAIQAHNHTHTGRRCSSNAHMEERLLDPTYKANRERTIVKFENTLKRTATSRSAACSSPTLLPVAVHFQEATSNDRACLVEIAKKAIAATNRDFHATNNDISQWDNVASRFYPGVNKGVTCVEFQLASKNHPNGYGLQDGDVAVTINQTNGDFISQWNGYVNIIVTEIDGLGYSPFGGQGIGDALAVHIGAFAVDGMSCGNVRSEAPFNLGRTLTHELGHYLFLEHIWGDRGGCNEDDGVADTPNQADANDGCPTLGGTPGCSSEALHMNHMDYSNDACLYMFTAGQARRMEAWVASDLYDNLKKNVLGTRTNTDEDETNDTSDTPQEEEEETPVATTSEITMQVKLDDFGSETTFFILDAEGYVVEEYGPFEDDQAGTIIKETIELPTGIYSFSIEDEYGDGICCEYGRGNWRLFKDGTRIKAANGRFGYWEEFTFAVGSARLNVPAHKIDTKMPRPLKTTKEASVAVR